MTLETPSTPDEATSGTGTHAALREKYLDLLIPGYEAEFDPEEAELAGAFAEDALSTEDAAESSIDAVGDNVTVLGPKA